MSHIDTETALVPVIPEPMGELPRPDLDYIVSWITPGSNILDLGCGDGRLLQRLYEEKQVRGVGMELSMECVSSCVARGVNAYHGDLDQGLTDLRSGAYDFVILNQTLQMTRAPGKVLAEARRVGRRLIVGFPNYGYWQVRAQIFAGRTPKTAELPYAWYNTPNYHFLTVHDFLDYTRSEGLRVLRKAFFHQHHKVHTFPNLLATIALFEMV